LQLVAAIYAQEFGSKCYVSLLHTPLWRPLSLSHPPHLHFINISLLLHKSLSRWFSSHSLHPRNLPPHLSAQFGATNPHQLLSSELFSNSLPIPPRTACSGKMSNRGSISSHAMRAALHFPFRIHHGHIDMMRALKPILWHLEYAC
jgi:hypothetical protein